MLALRQNFTSSLPILIQRVFKRNLHIFNRLPSKGNSTPYERLIDKAPVYTHLKCWGCVAFAYNPSYKGDECDLNDLPLKDILVCKKGHTQWNTWNLFSNKFLVSKNVKYWEQILRYNKNESLHVCECVTHLDLSMFDIFPKQERKKQQSKKERKRKKKLVVQCSSPAAPKTISFIS